MTITDKLTAAVGSVIDPELRKPLADLGMVTSAEADGSTARVDIKLTIVGCPAAGRIEADVRSAAMSVDGIETVELSIGVMTPAERNALTEKLRGGTREMPFGRDSLTRVIAVSSGKGGVGKSTVTANLAVSLAKSGYRVGLLDADVHGFSIPKLLGIPHGTTPTRLDDMILPPVAHDVKAISIGMFLREADGGAVAWRGPMLHRTVQQFLTDVFYGDLDFLLIDMPPGTGDVAISVGQLLPHAEVIVVTTPGSSASDVAVRSGRVARQTGQRVIGVVENMAAMTLPDGTVLDVFGTGGADEVAQTLSAEGDSVEVIGSIPLSPALRAHSDEGVPVVVAAPTDATAVALTQLADTVAKKGRSLRGRSLPFSAPRG